MESFNISAEPRVAGTKGDARKARAAGATPGNMYRAGESAQAVAFNGAALSAIFRKSQDANTLVTLQLSGVDHVCILREVQRHPVTRRVEHVDFQEVKAGERVSVTVGIVATGRAAGVRAGGMLRVLARSVNLDCDAFSVPKTVEVDVTALETGRYIKASQLPLPAGARIVFKQDFNVVTVEGKFREVAVEGDAAAKGAPGKAAPGKAAPAAKAAAKPAPGKK